MISREDAMNYVSVGIDDAMSVRSLDEMPPDARLVGWQCGFEPMFVAVWSYLPGLVLEPLSTHNDELAVQVGVDRFDAGHTPDLLLDGRLAVAAAHAADRVGDLHADDGTPRGY